MADETSRIERRVTVIVGVAVVTVKIVVAHSDVGAGRAVAQGDAADAATKAVDVIKETQTFDDHGRTSTCFIHRI